MHKQAAVRRYLRGREYTPVAYLEQHAVETPWPDEQGSESCAIALPRWQSSKQPN